MITEDKKMTQEELEELKRRREEIESYEAAPASFKSLKERIKDTPKDKLDETEAWVLIENLPNSKGEMGVRFKVKKPSAEDQLIIISKQNSVPDTIYEDYDIERFQDPETTAHFWKCVWQLKLCVVQPKLELHEITELMGSSEGFDIVNPLIEAINELSMSKKSKNTVKSILQEYQYFPELLEQLKVAYRSGKLQEFLSGEDKVVQTVRDTFRTMAAVQKIVTEEDAEIYAERTSTKTVEKIAEALSGSSEEEENARQQQIKDGLNNNSNRREDLKNL